MAIRNASGDSSIEIFERSWQTYHQLVAHDLMHHRALADGLERRLQRFLAERPGSTAGPEAGLPEAGLLEDCLAKADLAWADLACGDLTTLAPLLRRLPLRRFEAVDAAAAVLPLARERLGPVAYPCRWRAMDLQLWAEADDDADAGPFDLITCFFSLHHLVDADKRRVLQRLGGRLAPGGLVLIGDVFREPGESRPAYLERYRARVNSWTVLVPRSRHQVIDHMDSSDYPADWQEFEAMARGCGWQFQWLWRGPDRAEALLALQR